MNRFFALVLLAFGFASAARADYIPATWVDVATDASAHINSFGWYTYTHDLSDTGFNTQTDRIDDFQLNINLADYRGGYEQTFILAGGILAGGSTGTFNLVSQNYLLSFIGLWELNTLGQLTVTVGSVFGDFDLVGSTLTANGRSAANVPEPGALGLLGLGLVGMALSKRRRKAAKAA